MKKTKLKTLIAVVTMVACGINANAQNTKDIDWYIGVGGGYHSTNMRFSDIDENYFPTSKCMGSPLFSVFVQGEFGKERQYAIRPQLSFLKRGGKLTEIGKGSDDFDYRNEVDDVNYTLKAHYIDLRVPLIYNFGKANSTIRPYVYLAPVFGFVTGGDITMLAEYQDDYPSAGDANVASGYKMDLSKANMASTYFAGQIGVGLKFALPMAYDNMYIGVEANYECGFTDTYGSKEKDGDAIDALGNSIYMINGTRKFSGFELQATISIPFSAFKKREKNSAVVAPVAPVHEPVAQTVVEDKPCYTLDEINDLMLRNEDISGKTICAVDAINFDFAKSTIKAESYEYLDKLAKTLIRSNRRIEVKGHTDNVGSEDFNMNLSRERAEAVVNYLTSKGVNRNKLTYSYYGMSRPLSTNDTEEGRAMNRRVEFTILNNF